MISDWIQLLKNLSRNIDWVGFHGWLKQNVFPVIKIMILLYILYRVIMFGIKIGTAWARGETPFNNWWKRMFVKWGLQRNSLYSVDAPRIAQIFLIPYRYVLATFKLPVYLWLISFMIGIYYPYEFFVLKMEHANMSSRALLRCKPVVVEKFVAGIPAMLRAAPYWFDEKPRWLEIIRLHIWIICIVPTTFFLHDTMAHNRMNMVLLGKYVGQPDLLWAVARQSIADSLYLWKAAFRFCVIWSPWGWLWTQFCLMMFHEFIKMITLN